MEEWPWGEALSCAPLVPWDVGAGGTGSGSGSGQGTCPPAERG